MTCQWFELVNWSSNVLMCKRWMCSCMCSHEDTCLCGRINVSKCLPPLRKQFFFSMLSLISSVEKNPSLINYLHKNFFYTWIKTSTSFFCRIGFANHTGSVPLDWTLGAFIFQSMLEPLESEINNPDEIVGNESVTYFSLFAILLIALLAAFFVLQLRKPQLKTIYDLEKGRYIVTRLPR